jgi:hypothetical protein
MDHDGRPVAKDMRKISHPKVHIFIPVHVPYFGAFCFFDEERVGRKKMNVVRNTSGHDFPGPFEEAFGKVRFSSVSIIEMFHP